MEIYIIRHTRVASGKDICYGQTNVLLADTHAAEAAAIRQQLPHDFDAVYCSPLQRCRDLAEALHLENMLFEPALMEINFGDWENKKWVDIDQESLNVWMQDFVLQSPPNGETLKALFERVTSFLDNLRQKDHKKVLIVTHAGVIRCIWSYVLGIALQNIFKLSVGHDEILTLKLSNNPLYDVIKQKQ
jgi:alpha-ribazole phosphatase